MDLSWSTLHDIYGARARLGWRLWPQLSVGVEGGATGSWDYDTARVGGFVRYEWATGELSVSGGVYGRWPRQRLGGRARAVCHVQCADALLSATA